MQTRSTCVGHSLDLIEPAARFFQGPLEYRYDVGLVGARSEFWHHSAVLRVNVLNSGELPQEFAPFEDGNARVIT